MTSRGAGRLDCAEYAIPGAFVVNCTIYPLVTLKHWPYEACSGLGGSAAWFKLTGQNKEAAGWQDVAVISETGLCVWNSGSSPSLRFKISPRFLERKMALYWTGKHHSTAEIMKLPRDYEAIAKASHIAAAAASRGLIHQLAQAVNASYDCQLAEGMGPLPEFAGSIGRKYCGSGWGGYALYLFDLPSNRDRFLDSNASAMHIETYIKIANEHRRQA